MFRDLNEMVKDTAARAGLTDQIVYLCECGDDLCAEEIQLRENEYERVRAVATHFLVRPGHLNPEIEVIIEQHARYWVVEKTDEAGDIAEERDPRG
jgi:hypothetical protein